ncbi:protein shisa-4-like isoform X2 [Cyprinus carpio]|uniref:Protein shisa-5 n=1 Tax=Cyprinus carpio TaxID=7962 RepID=A0A9R0AND0_CYPCA|nr:protein shisa-4-like isoform X2 [Cyprinus carpio]
MASTVPVLLLLSAVLFTATFADDDCKSYITSTGVLKPSIKCGYFEFCCGTCDDRSCCSNPLRKLSEDAQEDCFFNDYKSIAVGVTVAGIVILIIMFIVCCVCPCCCLYKMCRTPRPYAANAGMFLLRVEKLSIGACWDSPPSLTHCVHSNHKREEAPMCYRKRPTVSVVTVNDCVSQDAHMTAGVSPSECLF